ncbi:MAG: CDP-alcohol phosphatidyltransferase family protein [Elusimicrobia bacterium]|nr:CDP-alcohol phosphatidyltransferase family protein [Elusimicrobiota bacterium]
MPVRDAVLWVDEPSAMPRRFCGMAALERQLFVLAAAGVRRVWVAAGRPVNADALRLPSGVEVHWIPRDGDHPVEVSLPYAVVSGDHFIRKEALCALLAQPPAGNAAWQDRARQNVVRVIAARGERVVRFERLPMPEGASHPVAGAAETEDWLLDEARKSHDGFMARVFDRHLSLAISRRLLDTPVTPNQMTVFSTLVGLIGCILFLGPTPAWDIVGAGLVWLHSVLDGCDGEIARLKYKQSKIGGVLDFWGDNVVHVALFFCLGLSRYWTHNSPLYLGLAALASLSSAGSAWLAYKNAFKPAAEQTGFKGIAVIETKDATADALKKVEHTLAQRDFIYLLVLVAIFHRQDLFLWCGAIGAPIFLIVLMYLTAQSAAPEGGFDAAAQTEPALTPSTRGNAS